MKDFKLKFIMVIFSLTTCFLSFSQEKIYYDSDLKICQEIDAEYYTLSSFFENKKSIGKAKYFYKNGELSWEGHISYFDKYDNSNNVQQGLIKSYYKNGNISAKYSMLDGKLNGTYKRYFESGVISHEGSYLKGNYTGTWNNYYESGKLYRQFKYSDGKLIDKFFTECDEFGACQKIFYDDFSNKENINKWFLGSNEYGNSSFSNPKGYLISSKTVNGANSFIKIPLNLKDNFTIETTVEFKSGVKNKGHGLVWGLKDWDNYFYFLISANGYYRIGLVKEGISLVSKEWTFSSVINKNYSRNSLKILRNKDKMYFAINGNVIHSEDFYSMKSYNTGFILYGKKEVLFENLIVKQDMSSMPVVSNNQENNKNSKSWKGNGSGLIISKDGYIVTNNHVVENMNDFEVEFKYRQEIKSFHARVIKTDPINDLAILKIDDNNFQDFTSIPYNFYNRSADVGTEVFALGYPMALTLMGKDIKFTDGRISSKTGYKGNITTYQTTTPIQPGNSGGPLFDHKANFLGINSSGLRKDIADNVSYTIKTNYVVNLIDVLPKSIPLPSSTWISSKPLTEQIKILSNYVVLVKVK
tara:strand:+ start:1907 stop:3658 length:1752 start_codon:yes stop_codon:yes gene_type:complete